MTAKEFVKQYHPNAVDESHLDARIGGKRYWLIRLKPRDTMYFAIGKTKSNAWVEAKKKVLQIHTQLTGK
jgi:hypothetical protein